MQRDALSRGAGISIELDTKSLITWKGMLIVFDASTNPPSFAMSRPAFVNKLFKAG